MKKDIHVCPKSKHEQLDSAIVHVLPECAKGENFVISTSSPHYFKSDGF